MPQPIGDPAAGAGTGTDLFERARKHFFEGLENFESGRFEEAEAQYCASLELLPGRASTLINLAAVQLKLQRYGEALASADGALATEPDSIDALLHRSAALLEINRFDAALQSVHRLLEIDAASLPGRWLEARIFERIGRPAEALASFQRVLSIDPAHAQAWSAAGSLLRELQRPDEAAQAFRKALEHGADPELHAYYLSSLDGHGAPAAAPRAYVQTLFDDYADDFDQHLVQQLHYDGHRHLVETLRIWHPERFTDALDLGCGTGLCGPLLRPFVDRLTGLDLSPRMLEKARALGLYDRLECGDLVEYLALANERHDLVIASDVFIYFGDLAPIFAAIKRLMDHGVFCFSVEQAEESADIVGTGYRLRSSLRYAHSASYLRRLAAEHGFEVVEIESRPVRNDQSAAVSGLCAYLRPTPVG